MSQKIIFIILIVITSFFYSFKLGPSESKLIGSWKVETVLNTNGTTKEGRKTLTFSKDKTIISVKDTGSTMTGFWEFKPESMLLKISNEAKEELVEFEVLTLTRKQLIIKDDRRTFTLVKTKMN